jgi:hypothetical protein
MISRRGALIAGGTGAAVVAGGAGAAYVGRHRRQARTAGAATVDAQGKLLWRNWSGVQHAYPAARLAPKDEGELATALKVAAGADPSGGGRALVHRPGPDRRDADLAGRHVGDHRLGRRRGHRPHRHAAGRAGAGWPPRAGRCPTLPDINKQSLGGALGTATHGTGAKIQALHGDVTALRLVTPSGEVIDADAVKNPRSSRPPRSRWARWASSPRCGSRPAPIAACAPCLAGAVRGRPGQGRGTLGPASQLRVLRRAVHGPGGQYQP